MIRSIDYPGAKSVTVSEILDRFKERKVGLSVESQYDPNKVQRAAVVLKEFLAERGRQYATVDPQIEQIPPSSLKVSFVVNEGPKVKVGNIDITGNVAKSDKWVINAMKNSKPIGLPHSILFENLFAKTYDQAKLEEDKERIRQAYQDEGYFQAKTLEETVDIQHRGGKGWRLPLIKMNLPGISADITLPVEEGRLYHLHNMNFQGVKLFRTPEVLMKPLFGMTTGDVFSTDKLRKGIENMRKLYGEFGYIDFVPEPNFDIIPDTDQIDLTLTADEGKQFFIRRIDFSGNTTTRDKVIRREILLDEGDMFNTKLWDYSILRLNQLGYFEMLKKEDAADIKRNPGSNTVDITLKVKERGKNSVGLNGGVTGIAGSFLGFNYSTNNFLGLGETLSIESQLGTRMRDVSFGFTEPYFLDRPLQLGFVVYLRRFNFDQGREASILSGTNLIPLYNQLGSQNLLNYTQNSKGISVSASYPHQAQLRPRRHHLRVRQERRGNRDAGRRRPTSSTSTSAASPARIRSTASPPATSSRPIRTTPSTIRLRRPPAAASSSRPILRAASWAATSTPSAPPWTSSTSSRRPGTRATSWHSTRMTSLITGYGGKLIPPFSRTYIGGEQDIRGFEIWGITPIAFVASSSQVNVLNDDGSARTQKVVTNGVISSQPVTMTIPTYQLITPGGDMQSGRQLRIPHSDRRPGDPGALRRCRHQQDPARQPAHHGALARQRPQRASSRRPASTARSASLPAPRKMRASTGIELQVMLPVVNAPFRLYWAYNPSVVREYLQPPIVADRSVVPELQHIHQLGGAIRPGVSVLREADDVPIYNWQDLLAAARYGRIFTLRSFQFEEDFRFPRSGSGHGALRARAGRPHQGRRHPGADRHSEHQGRAEGGQRTAEPSSRPRRPNSIRNQADIAAMQDQLKKAARPPWQRGCKHQADARHRHRQHHACSAKPRMRRRTWTKSSRRSCRSSAAK